MATRWTRFVLVIVCGLWARPAAAQFDPVTPATNVVERLSGRVLSAEGAPVPEPGDQVAAFFGEQLLAVFTFTSTQTDPLAWDLLIFGDDETTQVKEGPSRGEAITFRFFDSSTNTVRQDVAPTNAQGEFVTVPFEGSETFQFPFDIPGAPPFPDAPGPTVPFDLTLGVAAPTPPTTGGGGGPAGGDPDVNGDGRVDKHDAAVVMRVVIGAVRGVSSDEASRADVNGDGVVSTADAIAILSKRGSFPNQP
ncbi:MAG: hypothetical protein D6693_08830 [Planctomycetota bacterium]|nr:MAG: hypothetical protein D6693_08830 [Planctomycetota bacterium]